MQEMPNKVFLCEFKSDMAKCVLEDWVHCVILIESDCIIFCF